MAGAKGKIIVEVDEASASGRARAVVWSRQGAVALRLLGDIVSVNA